MGSQQNPPDPTRKYFDSGDYALQDAHKSSSMGSVQTGTEHPLRKNISHPAAPVPTSSNVGDNAADRHQDATKETSGSIQSSHLRQETDGDTPNVN
ncbi:hypothetical protein ColLi_11844 [Colletotrichum liriopes]|uniref:mRNA stability protein n=1 Tax=Colletotrichum liriopes TaxID=708192 RepID=A0AA37LYV8_9PEZI|nr:hypothetical protein ColLi_11844 [Colletotrichum liriopes]